MADDESKESASFLRAVLEAVPVYVVLLDDDDRLRYVSRLQPGFTRSQVMGRSSYEFVAPEYHELHRQVVARAREQGGQHAFLVKGSGADGGTAYYESRAIGVDGEDGKRLVYLVASDVTEHVARAEALRDSEEKLRLAVEATGLGLWSWDFATGAVEWTPRMYEITGSPVPLDGPSYVERCVHPDDKVLMAEENRSVQQGVARYPVHRIVRGDGEVRWVTSFGSFTTDETGKPIRMRGGMLDITEQRQTDERLRQMQKLDALGNLTAGVAHNFNNMLAVILPAIETALLDRAVAPGGKTRQLLEDAAHAARRAAQLVAQLMASAGQRAAAPREQVDLTKLLETVVSMCRQTIDRQCSLELSVEQAPVRVLGDAAALEQVFLNLILNARDALSASTRTTPRITVELGVSSQEPRCARVIVRDNGAGMSDEVERRLFEPFFTTKPLGQGTGLGLATSRATVHSHGGSIELTSELDKGTSCEVRLPLAVATADRPGPSPAAGRAKPGRILLVDDEPAIRSVVRQVLESQGHEVAEADSGKQAVAELEAGFDAQLVLLDRSMPGWPARRAVGELRARVPGVPIVFFTGQDVPADEAVLVEEVLFKPLSLGELQGVIDKWLRHD